MVIYRKPMAIFFTKEKKRLAVNKNIVLISASAANRFD